MKNQKSQPNKSELRRVLKKALVNANKILNQYQREIDQRKPKNQARLFVDLPISPNGQRLKNLQNQNQVNPTEPTSSPSNLPAENESEKNR